MVILAHCSNCSQRGAAGAGSRVRHAPDRQSFRRTKFRGVVDLLVRLHGIDPATATNVRSDTFAISDRADLTRGFADLALRVLDRVDDGGVEFVEQEACARLADVHRYFALAAEDRSFTTPELRANVDRMLKRES